jgi:hypothetical protein
MRLQSSGLRTAVTLVLAILVAAVLVVDAGAQRPERRWRANPYGRTGAEISVEFPRFGVATGRAYSEERDIGPGMGIGFGIMWGISDNLALDGRMVQTNHTSETGDIQWDVDQVLVGGRYTFNTESALQPFVGLGFARVALERDQPSPTGVEFERISWYGGYLTGGVDFIWSRQWSGFVRADYSVAGFGHETIGNDEADLGKKQHGDFGAVTLGITYRIPSW